MPKPNKLRKAKTLSVLDTEIRVIPVDKEDYISLTDMLKAKDGDFFMARNMPSCSMIRANLFLWPVDRRIVLNFLLWGTHIETGLFFSVLSPA